MALLTTKFRLLQRYVWLSIIARFIVIVVAMFLGIGQHRVNPTWFASIILTTLVSSTAVFTFQVLATRIQVSGSSHATTPQNADQLTSPSTRLPAVNKSALKRDSKPPPPSAVPSTIIGISKLASFNTKEEDDDDDSSTIRKSMRPEEEDPAPTADFVHLS